MKQYLFVFALLLPTLGLTQVNDLDTRINNYLNQIRHNPAQLRAFFQHMPKGGDLHHHYSGSIYAETYIETIVEQDLWVNTKTYELSEDVPFLRRRSWARISQLIKKGTWSAIKEKIIQLWSVKYYTKCHHLPPDQHFFATFGNFKIPSTMRYTVGLNELKTRAKNEKLHYIETMLTTISFNPKNNPVGDYSKILATLQQNKDKAIQDTLKSLAKIYLSDPSFVPTLEAHNQFVDSIHQGIDDSNFTMRYQNYVVRVLPPLEVFKSLLIAFASADKSNWIVGVNIVAPEHNETSMRDYWLHMNMFKYCQSLYPNVKYAMHAGELTLGLVQPEELSWHIDAAVKIAGAHRIGHGVDIMYENTASVLEYMKTNKIAVEINLTSNEYILEVKDLAHPISIYQKYGVPIVISTDDAGVLRSDLTHQYVLLANRYTNIDYSLIKSFVLNSITYSFLSEKMKQQLLNKLAKDFVLFEEMVLKEIAR